MFREGEIYLIEWCVKDGLPALVIYRSLGSYDGYRRSEHILANPKAIRWAITFIGRMLGGAAFTVRPLITVNSVDGIRVQYSVGYAPHNYYVRKGLVPARTKEQREHYATH